MIDFKKKLKNKSNTKKKDPIEIYDSLDRRSETGPLRPSQKEILENWYENKRNEKNNIIKLHTGEGKTLIGLLILQSKINSSEGPCLYVCPNKYLAEQVRADAQKFGIPHCDIPSDNKLPDDFLLGSKILITHVQKVFNGKTIFGLNNRSSNNVGTIILDDSHACIDSIKQSLTIRVDKNHELYKKILNLFSDDIREQGEGSFLEIENGEYNTMLPIPYWSWFDKKEEVTREIIKFKDKDTEVKFVWPLIKDQIENCHAFISGNILEISPSLILINLFGFFRDANSRILMSATTQDDSFFIKGLGFDINSVTQPLTCKNQKWSGEKMILIPSLIHDSLQRDVIVNWLAEPDEEKDYGIVALTPSFTKNKQYESIGANVADSNDIFNKVKQLKNGIYKETIVFANRYDGIDLPDNACRILLIDSKPFFDSLLDRYEESCRPNSDIINTRIAQKVEQGLGRSVRGEKDYSIIVLIGEDLVNFIRSPITNKYFSSQTLKQIEIGFEVVNFAKNELNETSGPAQILIDLMNQFLNRDEGWKEYYVEKMESIGSDKQATNLYNVLAEEYKAENYFFSGQYDKACDIMQKLCDQFKNDNSEHGWYLQQLARYKYRLSKTEANKIQNSAFHKNLQLLKPILGITYKKLEYINENRIVRIRKWISQYNNYQDMKISLEGIFRNLSFGMSSEKFECAMQMLGEALGFLSQRPDKEIKKGPDNLWCGVNNQFFLIECKSEVSGDRVEISKHEAGQMNSHAAWFESVYSDSICKCILVIPCINLSNDAYFSHDVQIMRKNKLKLLKDNVNDFFKEFHSYVINEVTDEKIQSWLNAHQLDINDIKNNYSEKYHHKSQ